MAAQSKLNAAVQEEIADAIRVGTTQEVAAKAAGITERSFYLWMERGESEDAKDAPHRAFRAAIEQARAESEAMLVRRISKAAGNGSWQAAAWLLERRFTERWAKPSDRKREDAECRDEAPKDPFAEVDELAERRRTRAG